MQKIVNSTVKLVNFKNVKPAAGQFIAGFDSYGEKVILVPVEFDSVVWKAVFVDTMCFNANGYSTSDTLEEFLKSTTW